MGLKFNVYKQVFNELKDNGDVVGILLVGKGATTSFEEFDTLNDIDLIVLTVSGENNRREAKKVQQVDVDMSYLPVSFVETCIDEQTLLWIEILASGKVVYSKGIDHLIDQCEKIWIEGPKEMSALKKEYWSFYLTTSLEDIKNRLDKEAVGRLLVVDFVAAVMKVIYKINRRFIPLKKKRWLDQIKSIDETSGRLIEEILVASTLDDQFSLAETLYIRIVEKLGGPCDTWEHEEFPEE